MIASLRQSSCGLSVARAIACVLLSMSTAHWACTAPITAKRPLAHPPARPSTRPRGPEWADVRAMVGRPHTPIDVIVVVVMA